MHHTPIVGRHVPWLVVIALCTFMVVRQAAAQLDPKLAEALRNPPVQEDGTIDFVAIYNKLRSVGVTHENNATLVFLAIAGKEGLDDAYRNALLRTLKVEKLKEGPAFVSFDAFCERLPRAEAIEARRQADAVRELPWKRDAYPLVARWIAENAAALDWVMDELPKRDRFYAPALVDEGETLLFVVREELIFFRRVAEALMFRAMNRIADGDFEAAAHHARIIHHIAHLIGQDRGNSLPLHLSVQRYSLSIYQKIAEDERLSAATARRFIAEVSQQSPFEGSWRSIDFGERLAMLDLVQRMSQGLNLLDDRTGEAFANLVRVKPIDSSVACARWHEVYDRVADVRRADDWRTAKVREHAYDAWRKSMHDLEQTYDERLIDLVNVEFSDRVTYTHAVMDVMISYLAPIALYEVEFRPEAHRRVVLAALATAAYHDDHQRFPETLDDLVPAYLEAVLIDPFTEHPLVYHAEAEVALIYSVGPNERDDGGVWKMAGRDRPDDVAARLVRPLPELVDLN